MHAHMLKRTHLCWCDSRSQIVRSFFFKSSTLQRSAERVRSTKCDEKERQTKREKVKSHVCVHVCVGKVGLIWFRIRRWASKYSAKTKITHKTHIMMHSAHTILAQSCCSWKQHRNYLYELNICVCGSISKWNLIMPHTAHNTRESLKLSTQSPYSINIL